MRRSERERWLTRRPRHIPSPRRLLDGLPLAACVALLVIAVAFWLLTVLL